MGDRTVGIDAARETHVGELAHHFSAIASDQKRRRDLDLFYLALPELDNRVPHLPLAIGTRAVYEEDLRMVREELRKLNTGQLRDLAENVRMLAQSRPKDVGIRR